MIFPKEVEIIEVGLRDGLQNEEKLVSTEEKKHLLNLLFAAGLKRFESTSFVHPALVPQMADAEEISAYCNEKNLTHIALTPNEKAVKRAIKAKVPQIALFIAASETFNQNNIRMSIKEAIEVSKTVIMQAKEQGIFIRGYVSMAFICPFEGPISYDQVRRIVDHYVAHEVDEIVLGDTSGRANPKIVYDRFSRLVEAYPDIVFAAHFHDTYRFALANIVAAMQANITKFDSSIAGLGGCPFSPGATGNVATEKVVHFLHEIGIQTSISLEALKRSSDYAKAITGS
jgi:hydroxymethylglutaryl-CoA lyase